MSVVDFLFEGKPPASVLQYGQTTDQIPKWMSDYTQGLISRANAIGGEPYQPYTGPRVAGFSPDQDAAFSLTRNSVGSQTPHFNAAGTALNEAANTNPLAAAQPYIDQASGTLPGSVNQYMDPYIQNVLNRNQDLAQRNLTENFLPSLQDAFTGSGQFGSERMMEMGLRGTRDIAEGLTDQNLTALSSGYEQAGRFFGEDQNRLANLATTTGNLETAGGELQLNAGQQLGALGEATQMGNIRDAASLEAAGQAQQRLGQQSLDLAYDDFNRQVDYPRDTVDWMSGIVRGLPSSRSGSSAGQNFPPIYQPSGLAQMASAYSVYQGLNNNQAQGGLIRAIPGYERKKMSPQFRLRYR